MKLLSVSLVASAFFWAAAIAEPINRVARQATATTTATTCTTQKVHKKITWNFFLPPIHAKPRYLQFYDLNSYASGYAWREAHGSDTDDHVTRRIMFENDQGWTLINCTWKFPEGDPNRSSCTSPDLALFNDPGTSVGDAPPNKGKIGTLRALAYPAMSPWAIYDLLEFRLTPIVPASFLTEQLNVEIFGWREDASVIDTVKFKIKGSEIGYKVSLPKSWTKILQWQVRISWGAKETRRDFPFVIDDVVMDEYAVPFTDTDDHCLYPTQIAVGPASPVVTLKFDDIAASPTATLPALYKSYIFSTDWVVTKEQSYKSGPGSHSAPSNPNSLYSSNLPTSANKIDADFLFDIDSFYITIDNTKTSTQNPANLTVSVTGHGACSSVGDDGSNSAILEPGSYTTMNPTSYSFSVNLKALGFRKQRGLFFYVYDNVAQLGVPFWIDDIVVRSWKDALDGLPGCERCGGGTLTQPWGLWQSCEYPVPQR